MARAAPAGFLGRLRSAAQAMARAVAARGINHHAKVCMPPAYVLLAEPASGTGDQRMAPGSRRAADFLARRPPFSRGPACGR